MTDLAPEPVTDQHLQPLVAAELASLAAALEPLPTDRWDAPSLCTGWRVRELVAHVTMAARYGPDAFRAELAADGFDFAALSDRIAHRDGTLDPSVLVADLRSDALARFAPPGGGFAGALTHVVVHGLDATVALDLDRAASDDATRVVLDGLTTGGGHAHFGTDPEGLHLRTTDFDWSFGTGTALDAPASTIVLALCGRRVPRAPAALVELALGRPGGATTGIEA